MIPRRKLPRLVVSLIGIAGVCLTLSCAKIPVADTPQQRFLALVRYLADEVDLTDPAEVGRVLQTKISLRRQWSSPPGDCKDPTYIRSSEGYVYEADADFWYKWTPEGRHVVVRQSMYGLPDTTLGDPKFSYMITKTTDCSERFHAVQPRIEAEIRFENSPGFTCITEDDVRSGLPGGEKVVATDGAVPYFYHGKTTEDYGVLVDTDRSPCAYGFIISQDERNGARSRRVNTKLNECTKRHRTEAISKNDLEALYQNDDAEYCGTAWTLMEQELGHH
jgi:hypothetical protein